MIRKISLSLFVILMAALTTISQELPPLENGVSQKLAVWRAQNYSDVHYKLDLTLEKKAPTLKGTIEIFLRSKSNRIILDWRKIKDHEALSKISNVSINGKPLILNPREPSAPVTKPLMYEYSREHLIFDEGVVIGENTIKLDFESPILTSGSAITRYVDKEDGAEYIYSLFVPSDASTAFPVFDQPDLKATFSLTLLVPAKWKVISNSPEEDYHEVFEGPEKSSGASGDPVSERFHLKRTKPISTYVFAFAAGEFEEFADKNTSSASRESGSTKIAGRETSGLQNNDSRVEDAEEYAPRISNARFSNNVNPRRFTSGYSLEASSTLRAREQSSKTYVRKSQAEKFKPHADEVFRLQRESIKYLEEYFDYKFPFQKYDLVLIPEFPFGGMEHAGATFVRESSIIFPTEPTANNYIARANLLFHENAHQWFGDTVTMKWFDDLWLKEGFATFMAYKAMEKIMPEYDAWKVFYQRTKSGAYITDVTKGTTPIYQEIPNLSSAKSAYGNIVYNKAPAFLRQAEFYLGEKKFRSAVQLFLRHHAFANAEWSDLVMAFEHTSGKDLKDWADVWVKKRGLPVVTIGKSNLHITNADGKNQDAAIVLGLNQNDILDENGIWQMRTKVLVRLENGKTDVKDVNLTSRMMDGKSGFSKYWTIISSNPNFKPEIPIFVFPNYQDYGYGIFLLDERSKKYILDNIQNENDEFLRAMMWGSLWDSVRFAELDPKEYVKLAIKNIGIEKDVSTISAILGRVDTAFTYYLSDAQQKELAPKIENLLVEKINTAETLGEKITFYRAFLGIASSENSRTILKGLLELKGGNATVKERVKSMDREGLEAPSITVGSLPLRTKDKFDIVTKLITLGDKDAQKLLAELEKTETDDAAKRYAYAAKAGFATAENKSKFWNDFVNNKEISESWIEEAVGVWNAANQSDLTIPYLEKALNELPNLKQTRKIFFINGWLSSFIGGQKSGEALNIVDRFLEKNPDLDIDLQRKILERLDGLERAVRIRQKY
ncbi:MAG: M1 family aminopeptidase [Pyrinomonadaceae bacterium]